MRVLIFGTSGFLGSYLFDKLKKTLNVFNTGKKKRTIDLTNFDEVEKKIINIKPNLIINSAGLTSIEECEQDIEKSKKINVDFLNKIFLIKKKHALNFNLIHFSKQTIESLYSLFCAWIIPFEFNKKILSLSAIKPFLIILRALSYSFFIKRS